MTLTLTLTSLSYDLKQVHKDLRRNVKFDEDNLGLYMDIQTEREGDWKKIRPSQAHRAARTRKMNRNGPVDLKDTEIESLLGTHQTRTGARQDSIQ